MLLAVDCVHRTQISRGGGRACTELGWGGRGFRLIEILIAPSIPKRASKILHLSTVFFHIRELIANRRDACHIGSHAFHPHGKSGLILQYHV